MKVATNSGYIITHFSIARLSVAVTKGKLAIKKLILLLILLCPLIVQAEEYICSYPNYLNGDPIIIKISVNGNHASVDRTYYRVLENNEVGLVLVEPLAYGVAESPDNNLIGLMGVVIDKYKMKMIRGNIIYPDTRNTLKLGTCTNSL